MVVDLPSKNGWMFHRWNNVRNRTFRWILTAWSPNASFRRSARFVCCGSASKRNAGAGGVLSHGTPKWINGWFPKYLVEKYGEKWMKYMKSPSDKMGSVHEIHPKLGKFSGFQWHISAEMWNWWAPVTSTSNIAAIAGVGTTRIRVAIPHTLVMLSDGGEKHRGAPGKRS